MSAPRELAVLALGGRGMSADGALLTELQAVGLAARGATDRRLAPCPVVAGGAGPSDHRALSLGGTTVMVPMRGRRALALPAAGRRQRRRAARRRARAVLLRDDRPLAEVVLPTTPRFYALRDRRRRPVLEDRAAARRATCWPRR